MLPPREVPVLGFLGKYASQISWTSRGSQRRSRSSSSSLLASALGLERRGGRVVGVERDLALEAQAGRAVAAVGPGDGQLAVPGLDVDRDVADREREPGALPEPAPEPGRALIVQPRRGRGVEGQASEVGVDLAAGQPRLADRLDHRGRQAVAERLRERQADQLPPLEFDPPGLRVDRPLDVDPVEDLPFGRQLERRSARPSRPWPGP